MASDADRKIFKELADAIVSATQDLLNREYPTIQNIKEFSREVTDQMRFSVGLWINPHAPDTASTIATYSSSLSDAISVTVKEHVPDAACILLYHCLQDNVSDLIIMFYLLK